MNRDRAKARAKQRALNLLGPTQAAFDMISAACLAIDAIADELRVARSERQAQAAQSASPYDLQAQAEMRAADAKGTTT